VPGATGDYFTRLHGDTDDLDKDRSALTVAEQKRDELHRQLSSEEPLMAHLRAGEMVRPAAGTRPARSAKPRRGSTTSCCASRTNIRTSLPRARTLEDLKKRQQIEIAAVRRGDQTAIAASGLAANPVYQGIKLQLSQPMLKLPRRGAGSRIGKGKIAELRK